MSGLSTERLSGEIIDPHVIDRGRQIELLAGAFLASYSNEQTRDAYRRDLRAFLRFADAMGFDPLAAHRSHVDLYVREMEMSGRLMPATISRRLTALSSFYAWCVDEDYLPTSPMKRVRRPKVRKDAPRAWMGRHQLADWVDAAEAEGGYTFALACLLAFNALRIGEVIRADVEDLGKDRHHRTLAIMGKGSKPDLVPLTNRTAYAIDEALAGRQTGPLILGGTGLRVSRESAARTVRRLARNAGIDKDLTPHSLRRSAITNLLESGEDLRRVQDFARHEQPNTTRRYDQAKRTLDGHAAYQMEALIASGADRGR